MATNSLQTCIKCAKYINTEQCYPVLEQNVVTVSVINEWVSPQIITDADHICQLCWKNALEVVNMKLELPSKENEETKTDKHLDTSPLNLKTETSSTDDEDTENNYVAKPKKIKLESEHDKIKDSLSMCNKDKGNSHDNEIINIKEELLSTSDEDVEDSNYDNNTTINVKEEPLCTCDKNIENNCYDNVKEELHSTCDICKENHRHDYDKLYLKEEPVSICFMDSSNNCYENETNQKKAPSTYLIADQANTDKETMNNGFASDKITNKTSECYDITGVTRSPRTRGGQRGRGVRVRGGIASTGMEVVAARGRGGRSRRGARRAGLTHLPIHQERSGPRTNDKSNLAPAPQIPQPPPPTVSTSSHQVDMEVVMMPMADNVPPFLPAYSVHSPVAFMQCGSDGSASNTLLASPNQCLPPPRPRQSLRDEDIACELNFGSEADSDESDDDELVSPFIPRVLRGAMETPIDADDDQPPAADDDEFSEPSSVPPTATDRPWRLYEFQWEAFPNAQIPPESRRETFSESNVGPTTPCDDPYDIFVAIWDRQIMEHIASETNRYAQQVATQMLNNHNLHPNSRICQWRDTTVDELYVYFGLIIAMGVVVKTRMEEYWSVTPDVFYTPGFSAHMSINRFIILNKCLHFNNNEDMCALELVGSEAKLFKIQPVLSHLNMKFQSMYSLRQNIALDESLLQWKGCLDINQLIPNKAATIGIKTYEICESQTGYLWRFEVHAHKKSPSQQLEEPLKASTPAIVLRLIQGLENKGYTLWMDNFYNSPCLARRLKSLGFDCAGTLRTNRKFVPQALHSLTNRNMRPGQIAGLTSGDVDVMVWRDNNRVSTISTYHGNAAANVRGSTKPILILDYNIMMGGVDKKDQMLAMYPIERKRTKVWYKKLFRRLLNVSVLNSYIIHHHTSSLSHRQFRINLVKSLLSKHSSQIPLPPVTRQNDRIDLTHRLAEYPFVNHQRKRRVCTVCKKRVHTFCVGCSKTVCIDPCFLIIHK